MLTGSCLCKVVKYRVTGTPLLMLYCHCTNCRRASGSSFATNVIVEPKDFSVIEGEDKLGSFECRPGKLRHYCLECGSPVFNRMIDGSGRIPVRAGTLDQDPGIRPSAHIWVRSKVPWLDLTDGLPQHDRSYKS